VADHQCDNCGHEFSERELQELGKLFPEIPDLLQRIEPGGIVPSGECPNCKSLCYPMDNRFVPKAFETALSDIVREYDELDEMSADLRQLLEDARELLKLQQ